MFTFFIISLGALIGSVISVFIMWFAAKYALKHFGGDDK